MSIPWDGLMVSAYVQNRAMTLWSWSCASAKSRPNNVVLTSKTARTSLIGHLLPSNSWNWGAAAPDKHSVNLATERTVNAFDKA
jgi:hypothetical protein